MPNEIQRPNIFSYNDPVLFLQDWITYLKKAKKGFNVSAFLLKCGIAAGYLNMVLKRDRELTEKGLQKMLPHLDLKADEKKYLNLVRIVSSSPEPQSRIEAAQQIMALTRYKDTNPDQSTAFDYLTNWHIVVIYEMVNLTNFKMDYRWIQGKLLKKTSEAQINQAIEFLKKNNFITEQEPGKWIQTKSHINHTGEMYRLGLAEFHKQMLEQAHLSIHTVAREERLIMGQTMALSPEDFEIVKNIIQKSIKEINSANENPTNKEQIFQIEIALFPLTQRNQNEKN